MRSTPLRSAAVRFTPVRLAPFKSALRRLAPVRFAPGPTKYPFINRQSVGRVLFDPVTLPDFTPDRLAPVKSVSRIFTPSRFAPDRSAPLKFVNTS